MFEIRKNLEYLRNKNYRLTKNTIKMVVLRNIAELLLLFRESAMSNREIGMWILNDLRVYMNIGNLNYCDMPVFEPSPYILDFHTHPSVYAYPSAEDRFLNIGKDTRLNVIVGQGFVKDPRNFHIFSYSTNKKHPLYKELYSISQKYIHRKLDNKEKERAVEIIESNTDLFKVEINIFLESEKTEGILNKFAHKNDKYIFENNIDNFQQFHPTYEEKEKFFGLLTKNYESESIVNDYSWRDMIFAGETKSVW